MCHLAQFLKQLGFVTCLHATSDTSDSLFVKREIHMVAELVLAPMTSRCQEKLLKDSKSTC